MPLSVMSPVGQDRFALGREAFADETIVVECFSACLVQKRKAFPLLLKTILQATGR